MRLCNTIAQPIEIDGNGNRTIRLGDIVVYYPHSDKPGSIFATSAYMGIAFCLQPLILFPSTNGQGHLMTVTKNAYAVMPVPWPFRWVLWLVGLSALLSMGRSRQVIMR